MLILEMNVLKFVEIVPFVTCFEQIWADQYLCVCAQLAWAKSHHRVTSEAVVTCVYFGF